MYPISENRKRVLLLITCLSIPLIGLCQKPRIDTSVFGKWPSIANPGISSKGNYAFYTIQNQPLGSSTLCIHSTKSTWRKEIINGSSAQFSKNGKYIFYTQLNEGLTVLNLSNEKSRTIKGVRSFVPLHITKEEWLSFIDSSGTMVIQNLSTREEKRIQDVISFIPSPDESLLLLYKKGNTNTASEISLLSLTGLSEKSIWTGHNASNFVFSKDSKKIAFVNADSKGSTLWYYSLDDTKVLSMTTDSSDWLSNNLKIQPYIKPTFSSDGSILFFRLENVNNSKSTPRSVKVDIWKYNDILTPEQKINAQRNNIYLASVNLKTNRVNRLTFEKEYSRDIFSQTLDQKLVVESINGNLNERFWNHRSRQTTYIVDAATGERTNIETDRALYLSNFSFSPNSNFLVYYDPEIEGYVCMNLLNNQKRDISKGIKTSWIRYDMTDRNYSPTGIIGWLSNSSDVLIADRFDIWKIDVNEQRRAENVTNGIGLKNSIVFNLARASDKVILPERDILLKAYNIRTKDCGFFNLRFTSSGLHKFHKCSMAPVIFERKYADYVALSDADIVCSEDNSSAIIRMESATSYPNYYFTKNFKTFKPLSDLHPNHQYNWISTELHTFKVPSGKVTDGVLYKPEDFDLAKKYPVIIYFYEKLSHNLNRFPMPYFGSVVDPSHFVSNGYLVFMPDMVFDSNFAGKGALQTVEAAADYLSKKPWVDPQKMGINGHSFGGYEANFIVTHSSKFAAAISGAGVSNLISGYGDIGSEGLSKQFNFEVGQYRMKGTPWDNEKDYVNGSPIFAIKNVTTPLLIFHNKGDQAVSFSQSIELFTGLRRAGKKVWLLQYDNEGHIILSRTSAIDLETKYMQFFDHFLKGLPPPSWMASDNGEKKNRRRGI